MAVFYIAENAPCFLDPRALWRWLRAQPPPSFTGAVEHAVWRVFLLITALVGWYFTIILESGFEDARARAASDADMYRAMRELAQGVVTVLAGGLLFVPPVWFWRILRRGRDTIPAQGVRLWHLALPWCFGNVFVVVMASSWVASNVP